MKSLVDIMVDLECDSSNSNLHRFLKNNPKNFKQLRLNKSSLASPKLLRKLRSVKGLQSIYFIKDYKASPKILLHALKNHRWYLKEASGLDVTLLEHFPNLSKFMLEIQNIQHLRVFAKICGIQSLNINLIQPLETQNQAFPQCKILLNRFWRHLCSLKHLKNIQVNGINYDEALLYVLHEIETLCPLLEKLHSFILNLNFPNSRDISSKEFFFPNIFNYVTKIEVYDSMLPASHYLFDNLKACSSLRSLSFQNIEYGNINNYRKGVNSSLNFEPFKWFGQLHKLQRLDICIVLNYSANFDQFFEAFILPESIESVRLVFQRVNWNDIIQNLQEKQNDPDLFKQDQKCSFFYNKWQNLKNLTSLALKFELGETCEAIPTFWFVAPLLKNISSLKNLDFVNNLLMASDLNESLDMEYLFQTIDHFKHSLEKLWIEDKTISLKNLTDKSSLFPKLKDLMISGCLYGDKGLKDLIHSFTQESNNSINRSLHLRELVIEDSQGLANCIKALSHGNSHLNIKLQASVTNLKSEDIISSLCSLALKGTKGYTISLYIRNFPKVEQCDLKVLDRLVRDYSVFKRLQITLANRQSVYDFRMKHYND